jgi:WD40 repeat protein
MERGDNGGAGVLVETQHVGDGAIGIVGPGGKVIIQTGAARNPRRINTAPSPPQWFVQRRTELEKLTQLVLKRSGNGRLGAGVIRWLLSRSNPRDSSRPGFITTAITTAFQGGGGFGKTTLAQALCHDPRIQAAFSDVILWVEIGETPDILTLLRTQIEILKPGAATGLTDAHSATEAFRLALQGRLALIVLDDVWDDAHIQPFLQANQRSAYIVTTRNERIASQLGAEHVQVNQMSAGEATELLVHWIGEDGAALEQIRKLASFLGEWPLLIELTGAYLREVIRNEHVSVTTAIDRVRALFAEKGVTIFDAASEIGRRRAVAVSLEASLGRLGALRARYVETGVFAEDAEVPFSTIESLWRGTAGFSVDQTREALTAMRRLSLFTRYDGERKTVRLHDVVRRYLREQLGDRLASTNAAYLDAARGPRWSETVVTDAFLWSYLAYHLVEAGRVEELRGLLLDYRWLAAKLFASAVHRRAAIGNQRSMAETSSLLADFVSFDLGDERSLGLIFDALRLSAHVIDERPEELAGQLKSRLLGTDSPEIEQFLSRSQAGPPWLDPVWPGLIAPGAGLLRTLVGHRQSVASIAAAANGALGISGSSDRTLRVWNLETGALVRTIRGHQDRVATVAISDDGGRALSGGGRQPLRLWDIGTGSLLRTIGAHRQDVTSVALSADGRRAVTASKHGQLRIWDLDRGRSIRTIKAHDDRVTQVVYGKGGTRIISASADETVRVWDTESGEQLHVLEGHKMAVRSVAASHDGETIVSASELEIRVWSLDTGTLCFVLGRFGTGARAIALGCEGRLVLGATGEVVRIWDLASRQMVGVLEGHEGTVTAIAAGQGRFQGISGSDDSSVRVWDLEAHQKKELVLRHEQAVSAIAISLSGELMLTGSWDGTARTWELTGENVRRSREVDRGASVNAVALSADGSTALVAYSDGRITRRDPKRKGHPVPLHLHLGSVNALCMTPDASIGFFGGSNGKLVAWSMGEAGVLWERPLSASSVSSVAMSPDGSYVAAGWSAIGVCLFEAATGKLLRSLPIRHFQVNGVAVTADGRHVVAACDDRAVRVWEASSGSLVQTLQGHTASVNVISASPEGPWLVSVSDDRTLKVWDLRSTHSIASFTGDATFLAAAVSRSRRIVAGDRLGRLHLFDLVTGGDP